MLVYGTCNPEGYGDEHYEGLYLTDADIREITPAMAGVPVKIEHRGVDVGKVVTAWMHQVCGAVLLLFCASKHTLTKNKQGRIDSYSHIKQGRMDVLMEIQDNQTLEGALGKEFIQRGICPELSLGYNVTMSKSPAGFLKATNKRVIELSIVRQGAREGCKIRGFATSSQPSSAQQKAGPAAAAAQMMTSQGSDKLKHRIIV